MTSELAGRLIRSEVLGVREIEAALLEVAQRGVPLVQVVSERWPELAKLTERELARSPVPMRESVRAAPDIAARLPPGMCERLLAMPIIPEPNESGIFVACADPSDPHVRSEFSFHLHAEVKLLRAPLAAIASAIEGLHAGGSFLSSVNRMLGSHAPPATSPTPEASGAKPSADVLRAEREVSEKPTSEPPIPLVRRSLAPKAGSVPNIAAMGPEVLRLTGVEEDEMGQPVLGLYRSKAPSIPDSAPSTEPQGSVGQPPQRTVDLKSFERLESADEVMAELLRALALLAPRVLLFAVKTASFEGQKSHGVALSAAELRTLRVPHMEPSVLCTAEESGHYLGPLPRTDVHTQLAQLLQADGKEIYAIRLTVSGRPAAIAVISGFQDTFPTTRGVGELASAASRALERIVLRKKSRR